jgi:O-antigen ligase
VRTVFTLIVIICLILTFSRTAAIAIVFAALLFVFKNNLSKKTVYIFLLGYLILSLVQPLVINFFSKNSLMFDRSLAERFYLLVVSGKITSQHFLFGAGLNNFIPELVKMYQMQTGYWILQPVHNITLLVLAEVGVLGLLLFSYVLLKTFIKILSNKNKNWLFIPIFLILATGFFDHYWLTLQQNMLLASLIFGLTFREKVS